MRYYDLIETPKTGKTFTAPGRNRIEETDDRVAIWFKSIDRKKYDRSFDADGYPTIQEYALDEDGIRYPKYLIEPDEAGVYQPDTATIERDKELVAAYEYLRATDFYMTIDKYATLDESRKVELTQARQAVRDTINELEASE